MTRRRPWIAVAGLCSLLVVVASASTERALVLWVSTAEASICPAAFRSIDSKPNIENPQEFLSASIDSLWWAKNGLNRGKPTDDLTQVMVNLKASQGDYECATEYIRPFMSSTNLFIKNAAANLHSVHDLLWGLAGKSVDTLVEFLNKPAAQASADAGSFRERVATIATGRMDAGLLLSTAHTNALYAAVKFGENGAKNTVNLTPEGRRKLMKQIEVRFGVWVVHRDAVADKDGTVDIGDATARSLYKWLDKPFSK